MSAMDTVSRRSFARLCAWAGLALASGGMLGVNVGCGKADEQAGETGGDQGASPDAAVKVLVAYFSGTGHTRAVAETLADELGADLFEIVPEQPYTADDLNYSNAESRVSREHDDETLQDVPLTQTTPDGFAGYDAVLLGYPIWWGGAAWPVRRFASDNDFSAKQVVTFCTSMSSGMGDSGQYLAGLAEGADLDWQDGQRFAGNAAEDDVRAWARSVRDSLGQRAVTADDMTPGTETYRGEGLTEEEIGELVVLDVKPASYFEAGGVTNQHDQGGALFCRDEQIMGWLFER